MNINRIKKNIIRTFMVAFWIGTIFLFLFIPKLLDRFRSDKSISILAWADVMSADYLQDFTRKTGIKVYVTYFENNEELFVKLNESQGGGYDLIMPSDYVVTLLKKQNLIRKLDKTKLNFLPEIYPALLGHYFDPLNEYTIPYFWGAYGIGYDKDQFNGLEPPSTWKLIFDKNFHPKCIGMLNDVREIISLAALYLFGQVDNLSEKNTLAIKKLLLEQKEWVGVYTDLRTEYILLTKTCPVAVTISSDISRALRYHKNLGFMIPKEGSFVVIDSLAMVSTSHKDEYVYQFLNYLYSQKVMQDLVNEFGFFPPRKAIKLPLENFKYAHPTKELFKNLHFFKINLSDFVLNEIWIALKS